MNLWLCDNQNCGKKIFFLIPQCPRRISDSFLEEGICITRAENNYSAKTSESLHIRTNDCSNSSGDTEEIFIWHLISDCYKNKRHKD